MKIIARLFDDEFPKTDINNNRNIVRAMVFDESGRFAFHHIYGDDAFGHRDYYETPGGGVDLGENLEEALKRECHEEIGYDIEIIKPIGQVIDYYNKINRKNLNHYFLAKRVGPSRGLHFVSEGDTLIKETLWLTLDEAERLYKEAAITPIARLVSNRELLIIEKTKELVALFPKTLD